MADITALLSEEDITVLGPPTSVNLQVDIGATGVRGSKIFVGAGNPNSNNFNNTQTVILNDLYIDNFTGSEYSYMYQYVSRPGGNVWVPVLKVNPTLYSKMHETIYSSGLATIQIPLVDILDPTGIVLTAENFSIQYSVGCQNPTATSISQVSIGGAGNDELYITFTGVEFNGSTWSNLDRMVTTHLFITVVTE